MGRSGKHHHNYKDGRSSNRLGSVWRSMIQRCEDKNSVSYKHYGGRGIAVCERWMNFQDFKNDMEEAYWKHRKENDDTKTGSNVNTTLDRINVNGNYEPSNCRWATNLEQSKNKRPKIAEALGVEVKDII